MDIIRSLLSVIHALAGAAWFGTIFYSFFVLHPRAQIFFTRPTDFEAFIATVSQGARWKVLAAMAIMAATGLGLLLLPRTEPLPQVAIVIAGIKICLLLAAFILFVHVSWRLWPARVLALPEEIPHFQRAFRRVAAVMLALVGASLALGVLSPKR